MGVHLETHAGDTKFMTIPHLRADLNGKSFFELLDLEMTWVDFAPPAPQALVSSPTEPKRHVFLVLPVGWYGEPHPVPSRQLMMVLSGILEVTVSNGAIMRFTVGDTALVEDTWGEGHSTRNIAAGETILSIAQYL